MPFDQAAAQSYYNTLPAEERAKVDASGGPSVAWLKNAANAGVPDAIIAAGGKKGAAEGGWEEEGGAVLDPSGAASASEWMGKRAPTPSELRKWAQEQHARYIAGDRSAQDEDYDRYTDRQLAAWINEGWDVKGGWKQGWNPAGKASDMKPRGGAGGGGGGGGKGAPGGPVEPTANPNDPLQSRLLEMFGGGEGQFAQPRVVGSDLQGGGVWWSGQEAPAVPGVSAALTDATLNAFTPNAPSARGGTGRDKPGGTYTDPYEAAKQGGTLAPVSSAAIAAPATAPVPTAPSANPNSGVARPTPGTNPLDAAVNRRYGNPNQWWMQ